MANIPIINPPDKEHLGFCWHHQFTIPLLFDDCLSILQKVCALWAKLNDVIDALNEFNEEFNAWAKSVEDSLKDLYAKYEALDTRVTNIEEQLESIQNELTNIKNDISNIEQRLDNVENRISNVENEITNIKQSITDINNSITQIQADMTALEARVKTLEDLLKNLNIIPPIDIYNATDEEFKTGLWQNWWNWMKSKIYFPEISLTGWEYSSNVVWWDTTTRLPRYFQLGRISQPLTLCKLPFIAVRKGVFNTFPPSDEVLKQSLPRFLKQPFTAGDGFFDFTLSEEFGYTMDEIKFQTSYIPFLPTQSLLLSYDVNNGLAYCKNINCGVRLQVPNSGTNAKLCVSTNLLTIGICPDSVPVTDSTKWDMYIYAIAENG